VLALGTKLEEGERRRRRKAYDEETTINQKLVEEKE
jgi:hypothetical protein